MGVGIGEAWPARQLLITQRLRARRADLGLTQKQVVTRLARCGVRTTNRALSSMEHGAGMDVAKLPELAAALDCTVTFLLGLTDDPRRWEPDEGRLATHSHGADRWVSVSNSASLILGSGLPDRGPRFGTGGGSAEG